MSGADGIYCVGDNAPATLATYWLFFIQVSICFQMKPEHKAIIARAMSFLITGLDFDVSLLSEIESQKVLDAQPIQEIMVGLKLYL